MERKRDWEFWLLLTSDRHWDSTKSDRALQEKHLKQAVERNAVIVDIGDSLDLMGGKYDPRSYKGSVRSEHMVPNYFDAVVNDYAEWLQPYANHFAVMGQGNHETKMTEKHEFCPTERVVTLLNSRGANVFNGAYAGWVQFNFKQFDGNGVREVNLHYHHGSSSGASQSNITSQKSRLCHHPDADIIATGHSHNCWSDICARYRLGGNGHVYQDKVLLLGCPSYKDDVGLEDYGWAVEKGFTAKHLGAWWIRFSYVRKTNLIEFQQIPAL